MKRYNLARDIFIAAVFMVIFTPQHCLASREDITLSRDYQLESEKDTLEDKLSFEFDLLQGFAGASRVFGLGAKRFSEPPSKDYLDALGMTYSSSDFLATLGVNYLATPRLGLSLTAPVSVIIARDKDEKLSLGFGGEKKAAMGDIYAGISYALITESKRMPLVIVTADINSAFSKYTSMGDGFWGFTPGAYLRKFICGAVYATGLFGNTLRLERKGVDPGNIIRYGAGLGLLAGNKKIELGLERTHTARTAIGAKTVISGKQELTANIAVTRTFGSQSVTAGLFVGGLEDGLDWGRNFAGILLGLTF